MIKSNSGKSLFVISCGLVGLVIASAGVLTSVKGFAVVDLINITVPESCTVEGTIASGGDHTKTMQNGEYATNIGTTTFKTYCNDNGGYAIYAVGYSNNELGNTLMKHSTSSSYDFDTGTADSGSTSNWAMKLTATSGTYAPTIHSDTNGSFASSDYHVVPSEYTKVVSFASNTDLPANASGVVGSGFTSTYAVWVSTTQTAGTYTGKVKYTLVHPATEVPTQPVACPSGKICYNPNGGNVEGTMGQQTVFASATSARLLATNFSREGYGFAGWSKTYDYSDSTGFLGPQEDITFTAGQYTGTNPGLSLYARWIKSAGNLQGWTGCSSLASGAVTALTDQRDGETYAVAKLADGNCWMIENLRLESTNSDNSTGALAQGYGTSATYGNFSGLASAENANFISGTGATDTTTANSLYYAGTQEGTATINISQTNYAGDRMPRYNNLNTPENASNRLQNPAGDVFSLDTTTAGMYSYGNYYTWRAAIADTTYYSGSGEYSTTSICPKGWRLPIGDQSTVNMSFGKLSVELGGPSGGAVANSSSNPTGAEMSKAFRSYPNNFIYSGYFRNSSASDRGTFGYYWTSTLIDFGRARFLTLGSITVSPGISGNSTSDGRSIRCLSSS